MKTKVFEKIVDDLERAILTQLEFAKESVKEEFDHMRERIKGVEAGERDRMTAKFTLITHKVHRGEE